MKKVLLGITAVLVTAGIASAQTGRGDKKINWDSAFFSVGNSGAVVEIIATCTSTGTANGNTSTAQLWVNGSMVRNETIDRLSITVNYQVESSGRYNVLLQCENTRSKQQSAKINHHKINTTY